MEWKELKTNKCRVFQLGDEPELMYIIKIRKDEFMVILEDGYDLKTGMVEFYTSKEIKHDFEIDINKYF